MADADDAWCPRCKVYWLDSAPGKLCPQCRDPLVYRESEDDWADEEDEALEGILHITGPDDPWPPIF